MLIEIEGDIVNFPQAKFIAHQCNCVSKGYKGVAKTIFDKFPYSNTYISGAERITGEIFVSGNSLGKRLVINMNAQYYPGKPQGTDNSLQRIKWFISCLQKIKNIENLESIAFPYKIGCVNAGGDWEKYWKSFRKAFLK